MNKSDKIFVAGHCGMVGNAVVRRLEAAGFDNLLKRDRSKLDLTDESAVAKFFAEETPDIVVLAAAKVGGIKANNDYPGRVSTREFADSEQRHSFRLRDRREETALSWKLLDLPEAGPATDSRNGAPQRSSRADE